MSKFQELKALIEEHSSKVISSTRRANSFEYITFKTEDSVNSIIRTKKSKWKWENIIISVNIEGLFPLHKQYYYLDSSLINEIEAWLLSTEQTITEVSVEKS